MAEEIKTDNAGFTAPKASAGPNGSGQEGPVAGGSAAAPAVAGAIGSATPQTQFAGAERRRSPRFKCEGSVELREEGCDVRTWATFTDVSLHGCYVEAQATYPVGTMLQMKLELNGFKVETKGEVRVNYPYLGMGIAFKEMFDENRARVKDLLASIARPSVVMGPGMASALSGGALRAVPLVTNPHAAIQALVGAFENREVLSRADFLTVLRTSQAPKATP